MASTTKQTAFRIDDEILDGLKAIKDRDGVPVSEQVRRALRAWIETENAEAEIAARWRKSSLADRK